ncbi:MAG: FAD-dependent oxidoreductase [Planctomycetes bacterium]|nr:FAD-dependent oxidoreductase [Planctomycetota bacterium]
MTDIRISQRQSTVVWSGDVVVVGGGLEGLLAALDCAGEDHSVCLLEEGPVLGREISSEWQESIPHKRLAEQVGQLCEDRGVPGDGPLDTFTSTLAFDRIVKNAGIEAIVRVVPTRIVRDEDGRLNGVEVVGKSGRQVARAETVIDATPGRAFSRRAAGGLIPKLQRAERRMYVQGVSADDVPDEISVPEEFGTFKNRVRVLPAAWPQEVILAFELEYDLPVDGMIAQQETHDLGLKVIKHLRGEVPEFAEATLVDVAPEVIADYAGKSLPTKQFEGTGLIVLADEGDLEERLDAADGISKNLPAESDRRAFPDVEIKGDVQEVDTCELNVSPEWDLSDVTLPETPAQLHEPVDVVVVGWGTGGALAALTAAEEGVSVTVVDPCPLPGGIATAGLIHSYYHGKKGGRQDQLDELVQGRGASLAKDVRGFHPVAKASVIRQEITGADVNVFPGHMAFGVVKDGEKVQGVVTAGPEGYHAFPCQVVIDGTGDGDVAAAAGAECRLGRVGDGFPQPYSYTPSLVADGTLSSHNFDAGWVDPTDTLDYSRAHFQGREQLWKRGPFTPEEHYCTLAPLLGLRESRFVKGPITLTFQDFLDGRRYPDTVCDAYAHYDNHAQDYAEESGWARRHVLMCGQWRYMCEGEVPYRTLYPEGVEGLLVACRALSVDHDLHQLLRMQRDLQRIGEICGLAAAQSVSSGVSPSQIDVETLRTELGRRGILPDEPAQGFAPSSVKEQLDLLGSDENGLAMMRLSEMNPEDPAWTEYFESVDDAEKRFCAAVAGALAGRDQEDVRDALEYMLESRAVEPQLGRRTPPAFVVALLALTELGVDGIAGRVDGILCEEEVNVPTILLLLRALADAGDAEGVPVIRNFLERTEDDTFQHSMSGCPGDLTRSYRFAVVLRAVRSLKILGCDEEDRRLERYLKSPHLLICRHARRVAASGGGLSGRGGCPSQ